MRSLKKILFICNTHFQCIVATTLKFTEFKDDIVDIIVTDQMNDSLNLCNRMRNVGAFNQVYHAEIREHITKLSGIKKYYTILRDEINPISMCKEIDFEYSLYDALFVYNMDNLSNAVYQLLLKSNKNLSLNLFEEGYSIYTSLYEEKHYNVKTKLDFIKDFLKNFCGRKYICDNVDSVYVFNPELFCWKHDFKLKKIYIPTDNYSDYKNALNEIFGYYQLKDKYDKKVIFFEECYSFENVPLDDMAIVDLLSEHFGKENIMVKLHPRNRENRFAKLGYKTNTQIGVPWEIIAINLEENDKCFITFSSGSVLSYKLLSDKNFKTIMLFDSLGNEFNPVSENTKEYFYKFKEKYGDNLYIPQSLEELKDLLKHI